MEEQLKKTLADYLKTDLSAIGNDTVIDRSALGNSIVLHRLYASFSQQGYNVSNYNTIRTFGDLKSRLSQTSGSIETLVPSQSFSQNGTGQSAGGTLEFNSTGGIGIDIEAVENFEAVQDYREHAFYKENFSSREISYCLLQNDARISLTGLFAAKEALVKADNSLSGTSFSALEIEHDRNGKPGFKDFALSISHTEQYAVAMAFKPYRSTSENALSFTPSIKAAAEHSTGQKRTPTLLYAALVFSLFALIFALLVFLKQ